MKGTFLHSHVLAATYGLIFAIFCGLVAVALQPFPFFVIFMMPPWGLMWGLLFYTIPTYLGIVLARGLAKRLGAYDLFAILAGIFALALAFGFDFASSIRSWLTSRGEIHGTILGPGPPPEAIEGWIFRALSLVVWIGLIIAVGIAWKRNREKQSPPATLPPMEISKIYLWLFLDSIVVGLLTFAILRADLQQRRVWSNPQNVFDRAAAVVNDKEASAGDRALALNTIEQSRDIRATDLLRRAVHEETGENQISAAVSLLGRDDLLALSVLEEPLTQGTQFTGTVQPTTTHTPSEGNGVQVAGFGHIGTWKIGRSLQRVKDPAAVPILIRLMASPDSETREGASGALRNFASPDSTDVMIAGLDDSDEMVRYFSVCTLIEIAGDGHYPAISIFEDDEKDYLKEWKTWAKNRVPPP